MLWVIAGGFGLVWLVMVLAGRGGLVHTLLLFGIAIAAVKFMAVTRARA